MFRQLIFVLAVLLLTVRGSAAQESAASKDVAVFKVRDVLTVWSVGRSPRANATHHYVLTHGLGGIDDRFFTLARSIAAREPDANVLVPDWSAGADRKFARLPNALAAADRIDLTGDLLGVCLTKLARKKCFDPPHATFIGESFGNCINHRAALSLRKEGLGKSGRALVLNPAPCVAEYQTPLFTVPFKQSIACVTDSCCDTRQCIANKLVLLKPAGTGTIEQHTHGMRWLQAWLDAGHTIAALFNVSTKLK